MAAPNTLPPLQDPALYRPQTWLLLLAVAAALMPLFLPLYLFQIPSQQVTVAMYLHRMAATDEAARLGFDALSYLLAGLVLFGALLALVAVALFRKRATQRSTVNFALLFLAAGVLGRVWQVYGMQSDPAGLAAYPDATGQFGPGFIGPVAAVLLLVMARIAIQRDIRRLQRMDSFWR